MDRHVRVLSWRGLESWDAWALQVDLGILSLHLILSLPEKFRNAVNTHPWALYQPLDWLLET